MNRIQPVSLRWVYFHVNLVLIWNLVPEFIILNWVLISFINHRRHQIPFDERVLSGVFIYVSVVGGHPFLLWFESKSLFQCEIILLWAQSRIFSRDSRKAPNSWLLFDSLLPSHFWRSHGLKNIFSHPKSFKNESKLFRILQSFINCNYFIICFAENWGIWNKSICISKLLLKHRIESCLIIIVNNSLLFNPVQSNSIELFKLNHFFCFLFFLFSQNFLKIKFW